ncbi:MAG TPA: hypothetical protein DGT23_10605 [Micromonosporaceae bacterium]|nr:hypothetical protein [Micromonosporaceae bacterium]
MHTQHAATGGHDTTMTWYGRAYTREAKPANVNGATGAIIKAFPRISTGDLWLEVIKHMAEDMPTPLVPATLLGSASGEGLRMQDLRNELMLRSTPAEAKDAVWRHVITQVRDIRHDWTYFALGLALPGLWNASLRIAPRGKAPWDKVALVHRRLATEFVYSMGDININEAYVAARLIRRATSVAKGQPARKEPPRMLELEHLDFLEPGRDKTRTGSYLDALIALARLVRKTAKNNPGRILTVTDAQLIAYTYIDGHTLAQAAPWVGLPEPAARMRRNRARKLVADLLRGQTGRRDMPAE